MVWQGEQVVDVTRQIIGKTNPKEALPGTIRGDYGLTVGKTLSMGQTHQKVLKEKLTYSSNKKNSQAGIKPSQAGFIKVQAKVFI